MAKNRQQRSPAVGRGASAEEASKESRWKDRITLALALWGAIVASAVAGRDTYIKIFYENVPEFYVRTKLEAGSAGDGKQLGQLTVRIANVGATTATLDPDMYVLTIDAKTGKMQEAMLTFSESLANTTAPAYIPGQPPTIRTSEEAAAAISSGDLVQIATRPLDYLAVKFRLVSGRRYLAVIEDPKYLSRSKSSNELIGWSSGAMAKPQSFLQSYMNK